MCGQSVFLLPFPSKPQKGLFVDNEDIPKRLTTEYVIETILIYIPYDIFFLQKNKPIEKIQV